MTLVSRVFFGRIFLFFLLMMAFAPEAFAAERVKPRPANASLKFPAGMGTPDDPQRYYIPKPTPAPPPPDAAATPPMTFYIAKGDAGACGEGCGEWIVAEGRFVFGTKERFQTILRQIGNRKLPVFFASPGGEVRAATALGRLLRQRGLTASIARTIPLACAGMRDEACRSVKKSDEPVPARLTEFGAQCNSACVYALIGAKLREIPPGALLGIHAVRLTLKVKIPRGTSISQSKLKAMAKERLADVNDNVRDYVEEMGVDPELFDIAVKVAPNKVRFLTRDEVARFGIDKRESVESPWLVADGSHQPILMKTFAEVKNPSGNQFRSSMMVLTCDSGAGRAFIHARQLDSQEDNTILINAVAGARNFSFPINGRTTKIGEIFYLTRTARVPRDFFQAGDAAARFNILEVGTSEAAQKIRKFSMQDLNRSLEDLQQSCMRNSVAQGQDSK